MFSPLMLQARGVKIQNKSTCCNKRRNEPPRSDCYRHSYRPSTGKVTICQKKFNGKQGSHFIHERQRVACSIIRQDLTQRIYREKHSKSFVCFRKALTERISL